jgi:hypothetical protein
MFVPDVFPQSPQNVATEFFVHHLSWWNTFFMHDAFYVKKQINIDWTLPRAVILY